MTFLKNPAQEQNPVWYRHQVLRRELPSILERMEYGKPRLSIQAHKVPPVHKAPLENGVPPVHKALPENGVPPVHKALPENRVPPVHKVLPEQTLQLRILQHRAHQG